MTDPAAHDEAPAPSAGTATDAVRAGYDAVADRYDGLVRPLERCFLARCRRRLLADARGRVLDVGVGTGLNFPYYPADAEVTAIDLSSGMLAIARRRAEGLGRAVDLRVMDVQALAFPDASFDAVASALVFCAVPDPARGLAEVLRVCRPGGRILMLEHVRSCRRCLGWFMDLANPLTVALFNEHINRDTGAALRAAGAEAVTEEPVFLDVFRLIRAQRPERPQPRG